MADNLIFPIKFDLAKGVEDAAREWESTYAKKLEEAIQKRPIAVKLKFSDKDLDGIDAVKQRLAQIKVEPLTPENARAIKELTKELEALAKAMEKVQTLGGAQIVELQQAKAAKLRKDEKLADEKLALQKERVRQAEERLLLSQKRAANQAYRTAKAYSKQGSYLSRLIRRMAVYASFSAIGGFLTKVREVTAEFELQRVSLGAIIQDQQRANQLFSEIKAFALTSPVSILDLTKYTKQLAAYKIGWDGVKTGTKELFETTKKLTDVSVGLGVSMDRVVLAYGQVRATGHLRASEIRQFTEMGVPIVEELASKLSKLNGETVTAAQVMDMVSKRAISFEMVKEVFEDMTSAGGMFYNMQEKQGNTLYGMWAKLGDAASVMYSEIGNTGAVNQAMRGLIEGVTDLMKHWRFWGNLAKWVGGAFLLNAGMMKLLRMATFKYTEAGYAALAMSRAKLLAARLEMVAAREASMVAKLGAQMDFMVAAAKYRAATASNVFTASLWKLWAAFLSNPLGWVIGLVGVLAALFIDADDSAKRFSESIGEIEEKYALKGLTDAGNLKALADGAVQAAEGSKEQREKLEELDRTYGKIVGSENLRIEKLREMKGEYDSLIDTIKEYNIQMKYSEREGAIKEYYGDKKKTAFGDLADELATLGHGDDEIGHEAGSAIAVRLQAGILEEIEKNGRATMENARAILKEQIANVFKSRGKSDKEAEQKAATYVARLSDTNIWYGQTSKELDKMVEAHNAEQGALEENNRLLDEEGGKLQKVRKEIERTTDALGKTAYLRNGKAVGRDTFLFQQMSANETMKRAAELIRNSDEMKEALGDKAKELEPEWLHLVDSVSPEDMMNVTRVNFDALYKIIGDKYPDLKRRVQQIQRQWGNVAPTDTAVMQIRQKLWDVSQSFDPALNRMKRFLWDGSTTVDDYLKKLKDQQEELKKRLKEKQATLLHWTILDWMKDGKTKEQIETEVKALEDEIAALDKLVPFVQEYTTDKEKNKNGKERDGRVEQLMKMSRALAEMLDRYKELKKVAGEDFAGLRYMENTQQQLAELNRQGAEFGLKFERPKNEKDLHRYLTEIYNAMAKLGTKVSERGLIDLGKTMDSRVIKGWERIIEGRLKELAERVSRTKTAKEFYEKILGQTGDIELATRVSLSIYGSTGEELFEDTVKQIREVFKSGNKDVEIDLSPVFDMTNQRIDYKALADIYDKYQDQIIEKNRSTAESIVKEGQKTAASNIATWEKELAKAKDYEEQRTDIINRETQRRAEIYKSNLPQEEKDRLAAQSQKKQDEDLAKVNFEEFTKSEDYIKIFENLDNVATSSLKRLRAEMQALIDSNQNLSPENMKTFVKAMEDIDEQISGRGFGNDMIQSVNDYIASIKNLKIAKQELAEAEAEYQAQLPQLDEDIATAENEKVEAQRELNDFKNNELATENQIVAAELRLNTATANMAKAQQAKAKAADKVKKAEQKVTGEQDKQKKATTKFVKDLQKAASTADQLAGELSEIKDLLGISEDSAAGLVFDSAISSLQTMSTAINAAATAQAIFNAIAESNPYIAIAAGVLAVGSAIASWISGSKVRKANKEIERQQELLDQLEYAYGRLEKAIDEAYGREMLSNYEAQWKNLRAQQAAYEKQAEAERSKGKKADKAKIKEYEDAARETADKIDELEKDLAAKLTGSDIGSSAREFAEAWLEAYLSFESTTGAIRDKFGEMIKNMVVNMVLGQVVKRSLEPIFTMVDTLAKDGELSAADIAAVMGAVPGAIGEIDRGLTAGMESLRAAGLAVEELGKGSGEYSGIARNVAGATSEEINAAAAVGNTLLYYASPIPRIDENVARIAAMLAERAGGVASGNSGAGAGGRDYTDLLAAANGHLESLPRMEQRLGEIYSLLGSAIRRKGSTAGFNTFINS